MKISKLTISLIDKHVFETLLKLGTFFLIGLWSEVRGEFGVYLKAKYRQMPGPFHHI
jgi:hypothetical protein